jgi:hypothetical protein
MIEFATKIENIKNGGYRLNGTLVFETSIGNIKMNPKDALEIVYTLADSLGIDYSLLDEFDNRIEERK